jgi:hypothetical protein
MDKEMVRQILTMNCNMKKVCVQKMVPQNLGEDYKLARKQVCSAVLERTGGDAEFFNTVPTG